MELSEFPLRFQEKVKVLDSGCWKWIAAGGKYGNFYWNSKHISSHRFSFQYANKDKELPDKYDVSHLCHLKRCVNPAHLVAESHQENEDRGKTTSFVRRTHCNQNLHELTPENIMKKTDGTQVCRPCFVAYTKAYNKRRRMSKA